MSKIMSNKWKMMINWNLPFYQLLMHWLPLADQITKSIPTLIMTTLKRSKIGYLSQMTGKVIWWFPRNYWLDSRMKLSFIWDFLISLQALLDWYPMLLSLIQIQFWIRNGSFERLLIFTAIISLKFWLESNKKCG